MQNLYGACRLDDHLCQNLSALMHTAMRVGLHVSRASWHSSKPDETRRVQLDQLEEDEDE